MIYMKVTLPKTDVGKLQNQSLHFGGTYSNVPAVQQMAPLHMQLKLQSRPLTPTDTRP